MGNYLFRQSGAPRRLVYSVLSAAYTAAFRYYMGAFGMVRIGVRQIAKLANVSIGSVDRALHNRGGIKESTRQHILAIAERLGYRPNLAARALSAGRVPIQIGVCIPREIHHYFDHLLSGIQTEARRFERLGVELIYRPPERLGYGESERAAELLELGIQALIIAPGDPAQLTPVINAAEERNIRVVCVDTDAPTSRRSAVVSVDIETSGKLAAELISSFVPANSKVAVLTGMLETDAHGRMTRSFCELYPKLSLNGEVLEVVETHENEEEAFQKAYALLQQRNSVSGLYVNTSNCLPVCRAICALGLSGKVSLVTSDLFKGMAQYFEKGTIRASVHGRAFAQGEAAVRMLIDQLINGRSLRTIKIAPQIVLRSNFHLFREIRDPEFDSNPIFSRPTRMSVL
jgi:LacI family transcriptional regulator